MGKQINQYTKTRGTLEVTNFDYLDLDASDDSGATYESAKIQAKDFAAYVGDFLNITTLYSGDGAFTGNRTIDNSVPSSNSTLVLDNFGLQVNSYFNSQGIRVGGLGGQRVEIYQNVSADCGTLKLYDANGEYFNLGAEGGARMVLKGDGNTSATTNLLLMDSEGNDLFKVTDDGEARFNTSAVWFGNGGRIYNPITGNSLLAQMDFFNCRLSNTLNANNQVITSLENLCIGSYDSFGGTHNLTFLNGTAPTTTPSQGGALFVTNNNLKYVGGDIEVETQGDGLIVKDITTGSRYRIIVDNAAIQLEALPG